MEYPNSTPNLLNYVHLVNLLVDRLSFTRYMLSNNKDHSIFL